MGNLTFFRSFRRKIIPKNPSKSNHFWTNIFLQRFLIKILVNNNFGHTFALLDIWFLIFGNRKRTFYVFSPISMPRAIYVSALQVL